MQTTMDTVRGQPRSKLSDTKIVYQQNIEGKQRLCFANFRNYKNIYRYMKNTHLASTVISRNKHYSTKNCTRQVRTCISFSFLTAIKKRQ